jgi:hypothetical protein
MTGWRKRASCTWTWIVFLDQLSTLKDIVIKEAWPEVMIHIFREPSYPLRGKIDDARLATALEWIPEGQWFSILETGPNPGAPAEQLGYGDSHQELRAEFVRLQGRNARIGQNPFDHPNREYFDKAEDVFVVGFLKHPQAHRIKNLNSYPRFDAEPTRCLPLANMW